MHEKDREKRIVQGASDLNQEILRRYQGMFDSAMRAQRESHSEALEAVRRGYRLPPSSSSSSSSAHLNPLIDELRRQRHEQSVRKGVQQQINLENEILHNKIWRAERVGTPYTSAQVAAMELNQRERNERALRRVDEMFQEPQALPRAPYLRSEGVINISEEKQNRQATRLSLQEPRHPHPPVNVPTNSHAQTRSNSANHLVMFPQSNEDTFSETLK